MFPDARVQFTGTRDRCNGRFRPSSRVTDRAQGVLRGAGAGGRKKSRKSKKKEVGRVAITERSSVDKTSKLASEPDTSSTRLSVLQASGRNGLAVHSHRQRDTVQCTKKSIMPPSVPETACSSDTVSSFLSTRTKKKLPPFDSFVSTTVAPSGDNYLAPPTSTLTPSH
ncbi:hypothetical protein RRG08_034201 [Elysia crispata]|uniref:Uncharacterized protein n=1 Tax=Elysia crispata TaxID=231223 RepID=A0AAE1A0Z2_9GAST|nr:hypothetical protein RRG08_034201 [Elysia crispata]